MFNETSYGLGELSGKAVKGVSIGGSIASTAAPFAIAGPVGAAVGAIVGAVTGIVASIFGKHAQRVAAEDEATGSWAASGPQSIDSIMAAWRGGQIGSSEAIASLQSIQIQYEQGMRATSKYKGKFGVFPDLNGPRPSNECNASCGMYWDLNQQIKGLIAEIQGGGGGLNLGGILSGGVAGIPLPILLIGGFLLFGKKLL